MVLSDSLVLYLKFNEDRGTTVYDLKGHPGTRSGALLNQDGIIEKSYFFDGTNDYVSIPDHADLQIVGDMTISCWVKEKDFTALRSIIGKTQNDSSAGPFDFYITDAGKPKFYRGQFGSDASLQASNAIPLNTWVHLVVTITGINCTHYLNGVANGNGNVDVVPLDYNNPVRIGYRIDGTLPFYGYMDEIAIWSRCLTTTEITELYNSGNGKNIIIKDITEGPATHNEKGIATRYPVTAGLTAGTTTQTGKITNLLYSQSLIPKSKKELL